jgi:hypothetical protein
MCAGPGVCAYWNGVGGFESPLYFFTSTSFLLYLLRMLDSKKVHLPARVENRRGGNEVGEREGA